MKSQSRISNRRKKAKSDKNTQCKTKLNFISRRKSKTRQKVAKFRRKTNFNNVVQSLSAEYNVAQPGTVVFRELNLIFPSESERERRLASGMIPRSTARSRWLVVVTLLHLLDGGAWCKRVRGNDPADETVLIVVSYDAFRTEYLRRDSASYMAELGHNGTWAEYLRNVFPTKTFPNHHSIATGVFPNQHGVMANGLYDHGRGKINYSYELFHFNEELVPIWVGGKAGQSVRFLSAFVELVEADKRIPWGRNG